MLQLDLNFLKKDNNALLLEYFHLYICSAVNYASEIGAKFADSVEATLGDLTLNATGNTAAMRLFRFQRQAPGVATLLRMAVTRGATGKLLRDQLLGPHAKYKLFGPKK